jgi:hypothetical protein
MNPNVPNLMLVRVLSPGGPYRPGDVVSVAFTRSTIGRLQSHDGAPHEPKTSSIEIVPHAISARVTTTAPPYRAGDVVTLSFVDPSLARIHAIANDEPREDAASIVPPTTTIEPSPAPEPALEPALDDASYACVVPEAERVPETPGITVVTRWTSERARRFVHVVDKLFTIDRLGWYRHVFAMRLLLPDAIDCADDVGTSEGMRLLDVVRTSTSETLGRPLLAAFMPNFAVSAEWLETIDTPALARALGDLRGAIVPFAGAPRASRALDRVSCVGTISRADVDGDNVTCVDAFVATLIPSCAADPLLAAHLDAYRSALADVFSQTSRSAEAVRLGRMCEPNHALDDRLWQLVGTVGASFDALAVA